MMTAKMVKEEMRTPMMTAKMVKEENEEGDESDVELHRVVSEILGADSVVEVLGAASGEKTNKQTDRGKTEKIIIGL